MCHPFTTSISPPQRHPSGVWFQEDSQICVCLNFYFIFPNNFYKCYSCFIELTWFRDQATVPRNRTFTHVWEFHEDPKIPWTARNGLKVPRFVRQQVWEIQVRSKSSMICASASLGLGRFAPDTARNGLKVPWFVRQQGTWKSRIGVASLQIRPEMV